MLISNMRSEFKLHIFICILVLSLFLINATYSFGAYIGLEHILISNVSKCLLAIFFLLILKDNFSRIPRYAWNFIITSIVVILINYLLFPQNYQFPTTVVTFCSMCMTVFVVGSLITDFGTLRKYLSVTSLMIAIISLPLVILNSIGKIHLLNEWGNVGYSMGLGNACTIPALILIWDFFDSKKKLYLGAVMILILAIISFGSRGPLLPIILFLGFIVLKRSKNIGTKILFISLIFIAYLCLDDILFAVGNILKSIGIESRTINLVFTQGEEEFHLSGRDSLYSKLLPIIESNPFAIRGINAEWNILEIYAHNLFIEIFFQLGLLFGLPFIVFIIHRVISTLKLNNSNQGAAFAQIFMFSSVSQSLFSGSLWTLPYFWLWFSLYSNCIKNQV